MDIATHTCTQKSQISITSVCYCWIHFFLRTKMNSNFELDSQRSILRSYQSISRLPTPHHRALCTHIHHTHRYTRMNTHTHTTHTCMCTSRDTQECWCEHAHIIICIHSRSPPRPRILHLFFLFSVQCRLILKIPDLKKHLAKSNVIIFVLFLKGPESADTQNFTPILPTGFFGTST